MYFLIGLNWKDFNRFYIGLILILINTQSCFGRPDENSSTTRRSIMKQSSFRLTQISSSTISPFTKALSSTPLSPMKKVKDNTNSGKLTFVDSAEDKISTKAPTNNKIKSSGIFEGCAVGSSVCEHTNNYPKDILKEIISKNSSFFSSSDITNDFNTDLAFDVVRRKGGNLEESLCLSVERVVYPQALQDKNGVWTFIVNYEEGGEKLIQGVRVEECKSAGSPCQFVENFPPNYVVTCKQRYIFRKLIALDKESKKLYHDQFQIPSCCSCMIVHKNVIGSSENI